VIEEKLEVVKGKMVVVLIFPDLIEIYFNELPVKLAEFWEFLAAFLSLIGLIGLIFSILGFLIFSKVKIKGLLWVMLFSFILCAICGFDTGLRYFNII